MTEVFVSDGNEYIVNPFLIAQVKRMKACNFSNVIEMMKPCQPFKKKESTQARDRKRNKRPEPKSRQANSPKEMSHKENKEPLSTKTSTNCTKHIN